MKLRMHGFLLPLVTYLTYIHAVFQLGNGLKALRALRYFARAQPMKYRLVSTEMVLRSCKLIKKTTTQLSAFIFQLHDTKNIRMLPTNRLAYSCTSKNMQRLGRVVIFFTSYSRGTGPKSICRKDEGNSCSSQRADTRKQNFSNSSLLQWRNRRTHL
jgi:hypothetical protein